MKRPNKKYQSLDRYDFGGWLKKNMGTIGSVVGGLGAIALTGGLAAPAVGAGLAGGATAAGGAAAAAAGGAGLLGGGAATTAGLLGGATATGSGLASTLGAASLGSSIGGGIGKGLQQDAQMSEYNDAQKQAIMNQQNAKINSQSKYNPNNAIFGCGGKKYLEGGTQSAPQTLDKTMGLDLNIYDTFTPARKYLSKFNNLDDEGIYTGLSDPQTLGTYTSLFRELGDKGMGYRKQFINNWNKYHGKTQGFFYDPNKTTGLGEPITEDNPMYKQLYDQYYPQSTTGTPTDNSYNMRSSDGQELLANKVTPRFAHGGYTVDNRGFANSELEDDEVYRTPQGGMFKTSGPSHAQGGIAMNLPQGTEILGKNKVPGTNESYKDFGAKLMKDYNKFTKILSEKHTPLAKKTANMMLEKTNQQFSQLMQLQEAEKQQGIYAKGGVVPQYQGGGEHPWRIYGADYGYPKNFSMLEGVTITPQPTQKKVVKQVPSSGPSREELARMNNPIVPMTSNVSTNKINKLGISKSAIKRMEQDQYSRVPGGGSSDQGAKNRQIAEGIGIAAPIAYNLAQGLFGKSQKLNAGDFQNPYESQALSQMADRRYNVNPELEANRNAQLNYTRGLRQGAPSQAQYLGNLQNSQISRSRADAEAIAREQNMNNTYLGEEAQMRANLGQQRAQTNLATQDINDRNLAAKRNYTSTALGQMQQYVQNNRITRGLQNRDNQLMDIYKEMYRGYSFGPK